MKENTCLNFHNESIKKTRLHSVYAYKDFTMEYYKNPTKNILKQYSNMIVYSKMP